MLATVLFALVAIAAVATPIVMRVRWSAPWDTTAGYALISVLVAYLIQAFLFEGMPAYAIIFTAVYLVMGIALVASYAKEHARQRTLALAAV